VTFALLFSFFQWGAPMKDAWARFRIALIAAGLVGGLAACATDSPFEAPSSHRNGNCIWVDDGWYCP
jgi:hypothetical protein